MKPATRTRSRATIRPLLGSDGRSSGGLRLAAVGRARHARIRPGGEPRGGVGTQDAFVLPRHLRLEPLTSDFLIGQRPLGRCDVQRLKACVGFPQCKMKAFHLSRIDFVATTAPAGFVVSKQDALVVLGRVSSAHLALCASSLPFSFTRFSKSSASAAPEWPGSGVCSWCSRAATACMVSACMPVVEHVAGRMAGVDAGRLRAGADTILVEGRFVLGPPAPPTPRVAAVLLSGHTSAALECRVVGPRFRPLQPRQSLSLSQYASDFHPLATTALRAESARRWVLARMPLHGAVPLSELAGTVRNQEVWPGLA